MNDFERIALWGIATGSLLSVFIVSSVLEGTMRRVAYLESNLISYETRHSQEMAEVRQEMRAFMATITGQMEADLPRYVAPPSKVLRGKK